MLKCDVKGENEKRNKIINNSQRLSSFSGGDFGVVVWRGKISILQIVSSVFIPSNYRLPATENSCEPTFLLFYIKLNCLLREIKGFFISCNKKHLC
jgi:hypothetical protein